MSRDAGARRCGETTDADAGLALLRALAAGAPRAAGIELVDMTSTGWTSATFAGARHAIRLQAIDGPALAAWLAGLPDARFTLRDHLVADLTVGSVSRHAGTAEVVVDALTLAAA